MRLLEQKGSAVEYLAKFRQIAMKTAFDDDALMSQFYEGLKEAVKDELSKEDWPPTLREFADKAIKIDARQYARRQEKAQKGSGGALKAPTSGKQSPGRSTGKGSTSKAPEGGDPMDVDSAQKSKQQKSAKDRLKQQRFKNKQCYECGSPDHIAKDCLKKEKSRGRATKEKTAGLAIKQAAKRSLDINLFDFQ